MEKIEWKQVGCMVGQVTKNGHVGAIMVMEDKYPSKGKWTHRQRLELAERITELLNRDEGLKEIFVPERPSD